MSGKGMRLGPDRPTWTYESLTVESSELATEFMILSEAGFRLALVAAHDDDDRVRVVYVLVASNPDRRVELEVRLDHARPRLQSLAALSFPASRFEREVADLFGVELPGHPSPQRLVLHQHWPSGYHPMRHDAGPMPSLDETGEPFPFLTVEGPGIYEIPVGPVHAGLIEPGHFRFSVVGETIVTMKARLWFVHKGIERLFEGRRPEEGVELAERISGDTAVGHTIAFCLAVEDALGIRVVPRTQAIRAVLLELERLYNHIGDLGALCNDVGYGVLHAHASTIRERLLRINRHVTGHRLLRGGITPGHAALVAVPRRDELDAIGKEVEELVALAMANSVVVDRFTGTSVLSREAALEIGTLGYVARASGVDVDARRDHPFCPPGDALTVPIQAGGDVMARFRQRVQEVSVSLALVRELLERLEGITGEGTTGGTVRRSGLGIVEGWRGTIVHRVEVGDDGCLRRVKIVDPSFFNWPALPVALGDTIVPDFPVTNKSFNLSYAGNDL